MTPENIFLLLGGLLLTLAGWTFYKFSLRVFGLFLGGSIGVLLGNLVMSYIVKESWQIIIAVLAGAVAAYFGYKLFFKLYYFMVFIAGWLYGVYFFKHVAILEYLGGLMNESISKYLTADYAPWIAAILIGLVTVILHKFIIIFLTAFAGAFILTYLLGNNIFLVPMFVGGIIIQIGILRKLGIDTKKPYKKE